MRRVICLAAVLLLVLAIFPASALAVNDTAAGAIVLTAENAGDAGRLVGDTGGAGRFYRFDYPGDGRPVKIDVTSVPGRFDTFLAFGFRLYGPNGLVGEAPIDQNEPTWTRYSMTLSSVTPGSYLILVYNYSIDVDFNVQVSGLPATAAAAGTAVPEGAAASTDAAQTQVTVPVGSTADRALFIAQKAISIGGSLVGNADGAFQYFAFEYAGLGSSTSIDFRYSPPSPWENNAVGFNLYRDGKLVAKGSETGRDGSTAYVSYSLGDEAGGAYLVQVFNYQEGLNVNYVLSIDGAAGAVVRATNNTASDSALVLTGSAAGARGSIGPGRDATFNYFLLNHPGGAKDVTLRLTVDALEGFTEGQIGFNLYKGADLAGQARASLNSKGEKWVVSYTITESDATTYGVQMFNYSTSAPVRYSLYISGLP